MIQYHLLNIRLNSQIMVLIMKVFLVWQVFTKGKFHMSFQVKKIKS